MQHFGSRGRGRGRSRGTTGQYSSSLNHYYTPNFPRKEEVPLAQLMEGLGRKIGTIAIPSSTAGHSRPVSIENVEEIASYSWLDRTEPTIVVPGSPPSWRERPMPYKVPRDTGTVFIDQNAGRLSTSPLLPLIAATAHHAPTFPLSSVDFVTDRNGLRKLWRWAAGDKAGNFRIDVELVGKGTALLERWEPAQTQQGGPGYERGFEKASTTPGKGCEDGTGHHRIITYDLDGLKMLVRYKADATLCKNAQDKSEIDPLDSLASQLETLSVSKNSDTNVTKVRIPTFDGKFLTMIQEGTLVPQSSLVELKTRSVLSVTPFEKFDWNDSYPQLLLSQTEHIFVCVHERGEFKEVRKFTLEDLEKGEMARKAHESLRTLRMALGEIHDMVTEEGGAGKLSLVCNGGEIFVHESTGKGGCLPPAILKKFGK